MILGSRDFKDKSRIVRNLRFRARFSVLVKIKIRKITGDLQGEKSFVAIQQTVEGSESNKYKLKFDHVETKNITGLTVATSTS
jgi:hypothetical protein